MSFRYGPELRRAPLVVWGASGYVYSERLRAFLGDLVLILERHGQLRCSRETRELLATASVSTVERNLREFRRVVVGRRMSQTKPGGLLPREVPVVVGKWRELDIPGYLEIDLVSHSGEYAARE